MIAIESLNVDNATLKELVDIYMDRIGGIESLKIQLKTLNKVLDSGMSVPFVRELLNHEKEEKDGVSMLIVTALIGTILVGALQEKFSHEDRDLQVTH